MTDQSFIPRTDLAAEALSPKEAERAGGVTLTEKNTDGIAESVMEITDGTVAARLNKPEGKYITLSFDKPWLRESDYSEQIIDALCRRLQELTPPLPEESGVLIVGLGLNLLGITKLKVMNYVPAIFLPILLCLFM